MDSKELTAIRGRVRKHEATQEDAKTLLGELDHTRKLHRLSEENNRYVHGMNEEMSHVVIWLADVNEDEICAAGTCHCGGKPGSHTPDCGWLHALLIVSREDD